MKMHWRILLFIFALVSNFGFANSDDGKVPYKDDKIGNRLLEILRATESHGLDAGKREENGLDATGANEGGTAPYLLRQLSQILQNRETNGLDARMKNLYPDKKRKEDLDDREIGKIDANAKASELAAIGSGLEGYGEEHTKFWDAISKVQERVTTLESMVQQIYTVLKEFENVEGPAGDGELKPTGEENLERRISELEATLAEKLRQELIKRQGRN